MIEKLTEEEIEFIETIYDPVALAEILLSDFDNLTQMDDDKLSDLRIYQYPLISHEYGLADDPELSEKENFLLRKEAGEVFALGGRLFGKTMIVEKVDMLVSFVLLDNEKAGFTSYDAIHIRGVLEDIVTCLEHHPFLKHFVENVTRSPNYRIALKTGYVLEGINMNITGKKPGAQFFQKHMTRLYIEEASFETEEVYRQRRDSVSENGCIYRSAGMTNFTKHSPCGRIFYDYARRSALVNLPQYVNPKWGESQKQQAIKDFNGEQSMGYRIFIKGEIVEDGVSVFDMDRVRKNYSTREVQVFEVSKDNFDNFKYLINVEKPKQAEATYVVADIGESAPTEIAIIFEIKGKYRYVYNVTLYSLTDKEQYKVFRFIAEKVEANFVALDTTDGTGRAIYRRLLEVFPSDNMIAVGFNEKIPIDFERHPNSEDVIYKNGEPVYKYEYVRDWSIQNLKSLFYSFRMDLPMDHKLDVQLNSVSCLRSGTRIIYECVAQEDHLFQAFQVFGIAQWMCEFNLIKPIQKKKFSKRGVY